MVLLVVLVVLVLVVLVLVVVVVVLLLLLLLRLLLLLMVDLQAADENGRTPLSIAFSNGEAAQQEGLEVTISLLIP